MNAALYRHSKLHSIAIVWLANNLSSHEWLIDFDLKVWKGEEYFILRPDIAGKNLVTNQIDSCVEISDSTLPYDTSGKKELFLTAGIESYLVVDCQNYSLKHWKLVGRSYQEQTDLKEYQGLEEAIAKARALHSQR